MHQTSETKGAFNGEELPSTVAKGNSDSLSLAKCLELVLNERLTKKQKHIISYLRQNENETATQLVKAISSELKCSKSAVWNNLNSLKRSGIISCDTGLVQLTECAKAVKLNGGEKYGIAIG